MKLPRINAKMMDQDLAVTIATLSAALVGARYDLSPRQDSMLQRLVRRRVRATARDIRSIWPETKPCHTGSGDEDGPTPALAHLIRHSAAARRAVGQEAAKPGRVATGPDAGFLQHEREPIARCREKLPDRYGSIPVGGGSTIGAAAQPLLEDSAA